MQFINLNFIGRKNSRKGKTRSLQLHQMEDARCVESHMSEIHGLAKTLYAESAPKKETLLKYVRVKLL